MSHTEKRTLTTPFNESEVNFEDFRVAVLNDYRIACESRQASHLARKEVLTGKAKFGIFGDGKEVAQIAMAKAFKEGDWRAGYYRDQTFAFATGISTIYQFFAQLYAIPNEEQEPFSGGRQMNGHFASRILDDDGVFKKQIDQKLTTADISTTGGQMARLVGLAYASKLYRNNPELQDMTDFSISGNEVAFGTVGNASCAEGIFFEAFNAGGVLQVPMAISVWDDGYGISVPNKLQVTKESISEVLNGFQRTEDKKGYEIFKVRGWDYVALCEVYHEAINICRTQHTPVLIHVTELTQPFGHSTSGSHERYKPKERLDWEHEYDCIKQMRYWVLENELASEEELDHIEQEAKKYVKDCQQQAWSDYFLQITQERDEIVFLLAQLGEESNHKQEAEDVIKELQQEIEPSRKSIFNAVRKILRITRFEETTIKQQIRDWLTKHHKINQERYNSKLHTNGVESPLQVAIHPPMYDDEPKLVDGREVLNACFDANFSRDKRVVAFGEDVGVIGDVNQGFAGLQKKHGELRITDTGIREMTIIGQGMGLAIRGLKPIAEIQYVDYTLYAINVLSDDLACLSYRTKGGQKAPLIIRTRGHRLEGIFHAGSPMGILLNSLRGLHLCVPRNMTQAAGMYNTLLRGDEPALVVESLNGYRLKERMPLNVGDFTVPLGIAEVLREGHDITAVSYGSTLRIVEEAAEELAKMGVSVEVIDVQTLLPFDRDKTILKSLEKTNKVIFIDEDLPGATTAYMMQQVLDEHGGYNYLEIAPKTLSAKPHRPPYGSDGDYFSKPNLDDIIEAIYSMMQESNPSNFPKI